MPPERSVIAIEVVYALPHRAIVKSYELLDASIVSDALKLAADDPDFAGIDIAALTVGIFGVTARPDQVLCGGDRIELYRPLAADPKAARRARVREARRRLSTFGRS